MDTPLQNGTAGGRTDRESTLTRLGRKLTESRFFMISLLVHAIVVIIAGSIVLYRSVVPVEDFVSVDAVPGVESTPPSNDNPIEQPRQNTDGQTQLREVGGIPANANSTRLLDSLFNVGLNPHLTGIGIHPPSVPSGVQIPTGSIAIASWVPKEMIPRLGSSKWKAADVTEKALLTVQRSLKWLRENQNPDGSWGDGNRSAMTGLALLCFLGFGELPDSKEYGYTINHAVEWLVENGTKSEGRLSMEKTFTQTGVYEHGIATYALGEFFALTHEERVKELLAQAIAHIVRGQGPGGGWMYGFDKTADDLSVSGWQIQALKVAHLTGLKLPGVEQALDKAVSYLERVQGPKGGYGYRSPEDRYSLSGVGILTKLFWKGERGELRKGMTWLMEETERNKPVKYRGESADLYAWYYHTQACLMFGGRAWEKWNRWFQDEIITAQSTDGSWPVPGAKGHGPQADPGRTGAVYRTTLCTLMLEVFYRYGAVHKD
ncbi:MAG: prenyltransferase/squalene oxidase repeat-containing protein [Chthoniobacteraceae bacterium]